MKNIRNDIAHGKNCWIEVGVWSNAEVKCNRLKKHIHCRNCPVFSAEGRRVLDNVAPINYLSEWRKKLSEKQLIVNQDAQSILVFRLNNEWFALSTSCIGEITEKRTIHRIPRNSNKDVEGIVNVDGEIQLCYSLENVLGVKHAVENKNDISVIGRFVVALLGEQNYVFRVDYINGLSWYASKDLLPTPSTLEYEGSGMILGVIDENDRKVAVLDVAKLQSKLERIIL